MNEMNPSGDACQDIRYSGKISLQRFVCVKTRELSKPGVMK
jgi:hypothetical protein